MQKLHEIYLHDSVIDLVEYPSGTCNVRVIGSKLKSSGLEIECCGSDGLAEKLRGTT